MNTATFKGYGVGAPDVTIVLDRIVSFYRVEYNGRSGTCIVLDTGKEITVDEYPSAVNMVMQQAKE